MEASFITLPSASYPELNVGDSIVGRQPALTLFPLWISSIICAARNQNAVWLLSSSQSVQVRTKSPWMIAMTRLAILSVAGLLALAAPASAQHVIYNPGWCAQFYPNANCQNYGPGNPYTSYGWRGAYASYGNYPRRVYHHRYRRY